MCYSVYVEENTSALVLIHQPVTNFDLFILCRSVYFTVCLVGGYVISLLVASAMEIFQSITSSVFIAK